jgi:hypothetical protein
MEYGVDLSCWDYTLIYMNGLIPVLTQLWIVIGFTNPVDFRKFIGNHGKAIRHKV